MNDGPVICPACGQSSPRGKRFCGDCGAPLPLSCPACGAANPPGKRFCGDCGTLLASDSPETQAPLAIGAIVPAGLEPPVAPPPDLERRLATILFADLVDSTILGETLDPEEVHGLFEAAQSVLAATVERYGGYVAQYLGDGLLALFGAPTAQEDDAERAVIAGLQMHQALMAVNETRPPELPALRLRVGVATGEVVAGLMGNAYGVRGDAANTAARMQGMAVPGGVLVDVATMELAERRIRFGERQDLILKGKAGVVPAYAALAVRETLVERWERQAQRIPLVGRDRDLAQVRALWHRAQTGDGQLLTIVGEAGVGKSRLLAETLDGIVAADEARVLRARTLSYGQGLSLWLLADLVRALCGVHEQDPLDDVRKRLAASVMTLLADHDSETRAGALDVLGEVLGLPVGASVVAQAGTQARRHWVVRSLRLLLGGLSVREPVVLALEDLHWSDASSSEILADVLSDVPGLRMLVLATQRPGWTAPWSAWGWTERLTLHSLGAEDAHDLAQAILGGRPLTPDLERYVAERAGGNPFFVEELLRSLQDAGNLEEQAGQVAVHTQTHHQLPATLTEVLLARLDGLEPSARRLAQVASVLGRSVPVRVLAQVMSQEMTLLEPLLGVLQRADILFPRPTVDREYIFKHAVLRDVAYQTLARPQRQVLHLRAARTLAALYPATEYVEIIAYHYRETEEPGEAAPWLERAGDYAASVFANAVAIEHYAEARQRYALSHADRLTLARLDEKRGSVLTLAGQYQQAVADLERALEVNQTAHDLDGRNRVLVQMGLLHAFRGTPDEGVELIQSHLGAMHAPNSSPGLAELYNILSLLFFSGGQYRESEKASEWAAEAAQMRGDAQILARAQVNRVNAVELMGRYDDAMRIAEETIPVLEASGDLLYLVQALVDLGEAQAVKGDYAASVATYKRARDVSERLGEEGFMLLALAYWTWAAFMQGDWDDAQVKTEQALAITQRRQASWFTPYPLFKGAVLILARGEWDRATAYAQEAAALAERTGDLQACRGAAGVLAELDIVQGRPEAAQARLLTMMDRPGLEESNVTQILPLLAWAHLEAGDVGQASEVVMQALTRIRPENMRAFLVDALRVQALVAIRREQWAEATAALEEGLGMARAMPYPYAEGRLLYVYGQIHLQKGEPELARARLEAALAIFRRLGARKDIERAEQAIAALQSDC